MPSPGLGVTDLLATTDGTANHGRVWGVGEFFPPVVAVAAGGYEGACAVHWRLLVVRRWGAALPTVGSRFGDTSAG